MDILEEQATTRVPDLVPIRYGRMLASPFAFFRGAAAVIAMDLAKTPQSELWVQLCGDAHLSNFGSFAAPDRDLVFDVNDFDETLPGPWEWDVKRLAASLAIAGRGNGFGESERRLVVAAAAREYRESMRQFASQGNLDVWYLRLDVAKTVQDVQGQGQLRKRDVKNLERGIAKARAKTSLRAFSKLTHRVDGELRIVNDPPLIVPIEDAYPGVDGQRAEDRLRAIFEDYGASLDDDRRRLLDGYRYVHSARKVVGVGSVGTRAFIALFVGRDDADPLFLQIKEAQRSVLEPYTAPCEFAQEGERVVRGQRLMQAASDIFLGWFTTVGIDGESRDFYVRQLWDEKGSFEIESMDPRGMTAYAKACGWTLARAHARSGDRIAIAAYLGAGDNFDRAIADFAEAYADQNESDYDRLRRAVTDGRIATLEGV